MQAVQYEQLVSPGESPTYTDHHRPLQEPSPTKSPTPKNVAFELLLDENSKSRARIPMRVQIYPHDTTDSIVTTVKNFYGIYGGAAGVSFEDANGITLIARYENLRNNMTVYVRVMPVQPYEEEYPDAYYGAMHIDHNKRPSLGEPFQMASALQAMQPSELGHSPSRPASRSAHRRSVSPSGRSRRSASQHKHLSRPALKSRGSSAHGSAYDDAGYSDSDNGYGSVSGARKPRSEHFASSEISMENILQDGRRKRPKFDSSELPLFVPPQVPLTTSTSSISPQRRSVGQEAVGSPFARPMQRTQGYYQQALPSPQSYGHSDHIYGASTRNGIYTTPIVPDHGHRLRDRTVMHPSAQYPNSASRNGAQPILPTPDPTIASCISDEDVALQLIRLGDASNFSHGRTSASTLDDAFSGAADAASSTGATSDGEEYSEDDDDLPDGPRQRQDSSPMLPPGTAKHTHKRLDDILPSFDSSEASYDSPDNEYRYDDFEGSMLKNEVDEDGFQEPRPKKIKSRAISTVSSKPRSNKPSQPRPNKGATKSASNGAVRKVKSAPTVPGQKAAAPPMANPAPPRKASTSSVNGQNPLAADEEDLSTKPRCQRCRKSKKGCDRQRPCGRCKDAGIGIEGCISEDEGNGRKGRYGRHMGVPVKKGLDGEIIVEDMPPPIPVIPMAAPMVDKNKKRKR